MKQYRPIALFLALLLSAAFIFSCSGKGGSTSTTLSTDTEGNLVDSEGNVISNPFENPIIVGDVSFTLPHVPQDIPLGTTTTTTRRPSNPTPPTNPDLPDLPDIPDRTEDPEAPKETPVTGEDFEGWFESMNVVPVVGSASGGISFFNDTTEALPSLYDGLDGCISGEDWTKMGGGASRGCYVILEVAPDSEVSAYALVTANDSGTYERTPGSWRLWATDVDPAEATEEDWTEIDYVYDGATENADFTPFGYTVDEDKVGGYKYYKFEFLYGIDQPISAIQLCEIWLLS